MMCRTRSTAAAMLALVLTASSSPAQRLMRIEPGPSDPPPNGPEPPKLPVFEEYEGIVAYVRGLTANQIDPDLPAIEIGHWLSAAVWPQSKGGPPPLPQWDLGYCEDRTSNAPAFAPEVCVTGTLAVSETRALTFTVAAARPRPVADGERRWLLIPPSVRRIRLSEEIAPGGNGDALDIPALRDLRERLELPIARWPKIDLQAAVQSTHTRALPGDVVTFTLRVRNAGKRDLERAEVNVYLKLFGSPEQERRYIWWPPIPAGHTADIRFSATMPGGGAVNISAWPFGPFVTDLRPDDNEAIAWVSEPTDPVDAKPDPKLANPAGIPPLER